MYDFYVYIHTSFVIWFQFPFAGILCMYLLFYLLAQQEGAFNDEIAPIEVKVRRKMETFDMDEHPRPDVTLEQLQKLPPVFKKNGTVSAGNASVNFVFDAPKSFYS